jgi:hypothetical protein
MKGNPVMLIEPATDSGGFKIELTEIRICPAAIGIQFNQVDQTTDPFRIGSWDFQWAAFFAGTKSGRQGIPGTPVKIDILLVWFPSWTGGSTEYASRSDSDKKHAFILLIAIA